MQARAREAVFWNCARTAPWGSKVHDREGARSGAVAVAAGAVAVAAGTADLCRRRRAPGRVSVLCVLIVWQAALCGSYFWAQQRGWCLPCRLRTVKRRKC